MPIPWKCILFISFILILGCPIQTKSIWMTDFNINSNWLVSNNHWLSIQIWKLSLMCISWDVHLCLGQGWAHHYLWTWWRHWSQQLDRHQECWSAMGTRYLRDSPDTCTQQPEVKGGPAGWWTDSLWWEFHELSEIGFLSIKCIFNILIIMNFYVSITSTVFGD